MLIFINFNKVAYPKWDKMKYIHVFNPEYKKHLYGFLTLESRY